MKKVLLLLAIIIMTSIASAQVKKFSISPKVGVGNATFTNKEDGAKSTYLSYLLGAQSNYKFTDQVSIGLDAYYTRFGGENDNIGSYLYNDYINVPIYVRYFLPSSGFNFQVGPEIGFLVKSTFNEEPADFMWKDVNFGLNLGAGYWFKNNINVDLRFNPGLSNIGEIVNTKTNMLSVSLGYWF